MRRYRLIVPAGRAVVNCPDPLAPAVTTVVQVWPSIEVLNSYAEAQADSHTMEALHMAIAVPKSSDSHCGSMPCADSQRVAALPSMANAALPLDAVTLAVSA